MKPLNRCVWMASSLAACWLASGCATPQAALDQANNGAALALSLQAELKVFRAVQADIARARIDSVRRQQVLLAGYESEGAFDDRILQLAGKKKALELQAALKELSDRKVRDELALADRIEKMDDSFAKLLAPLPDSAGKLIAAQKALAVMGEELSPKERLALASDFAKDIKKTIEENKKKIEDAAAATPVASAQPAAPGK